MTKVVMSMFMSLDGFFAGPGGAFVPPEWSDEMETWALEAMAQSGRFLYGRVNFEFNKAFWSDLSGPAGGIAYAAEMNAKPKTVFSTTLRGDPGWNGTVANGDLPGTIAALKAEGGKDLFTFGGGGIANSLMKLDLIDEYRILVVPILLGDGMRLFEGGTERMKLKRVETRAIDTGAVLLRYTREREG